MSKCYENIGICKRWESFERFLSDMGERPYPQATIDRIDGNQGYDPANCRWATMEEQQNNRSNNVFVVVGEEVLSPKKAAIKLGIKRSALSKRLAKNYNRKENLYFL